MSRNVNQWFQLTKVAVCAAVCAGLSPVSFGVTTLAGKLEGHFEVDAMGGANYTMPLTGPPGRQGVEPGLSLEYNSQGGDGLLGMGWRMKGLSFITRCNLNRGQVKDRDPTGPVSLHTVQYKKDDGYCLDGQLLVAVEGQHGESGTVYRTERDAWVQVVSHGASGAGPEWFEVTTASGEVSEYGGNGKHLKANRYLSPANAWIPRHEISIWPIVKKTDRNGNAMEYDYSVNESSGSLVPTQINYGGTSGSHPYAVKFHYKASGHSRTSYNTGARSTIDKVIHAIEFYTDGEQIKRYAVAYRQSPTTQRDLIASIQACVGDSCLPATRFEWLQSTGDYQLFDTDDVFFTTAEEETCYGGENQEYLDRACTWHVDVDGDGIVDYVHRHAQQGIQVLFGSPQGFVKRGSTPDGICADESTAYGKCNDADNFDYIGFTDVNGDGKADLVYRGDEGIQLWFGSEEGFTERVSSNICGNTDGGCDKKKNWDYFFFPDLNGDGKADLVYRAHNGLTNVLGTEEGFTGPRHESGKCSDQDIKCYDETSWDYIRFRDVNGNGRADLIHRSVSHGITVDYSADWFGGSISWNDLGGIFDSNSSGVCDNLDSTCDNASYWNDIQYPDLDGDGRAEFFARTSQGIEFYREASDGGYESTRYRRYAICSSGHGQCNSAEHYDTMRFVDLNSDGQLDFVYRGADGVHINLMNGDYIVKSFNTGLCDEDEDCRNSSIDFVNLDGDEFLDMVWYKEEGYTLRVHRDIAKGYNSALHFEAQHCMPVHNDYCRYNRGDARHSIRLLDATGDGRADAVFRSVNGITVAPVLLGKADAIKTITDGLGHTINVEYAPLADNTVYTQEAGLAHHEVMGDRAGDLDVVNPDWRNVQMPVHVVSKHHYEQGDGSCTTPQRSRAQLNNNVQSCWSYEYSYEELTLDKYRGLLGFKRSIVKDLQYQHQRVTWNLLNVAHRGLPGRSALYSLTPQGAPDALISSERYSYECSRPDCRGEDGIYRALLKEKQVEHYSINDEADAVRSSDITSMTYDDPVATNGKPVAIREQKKGKLGSTTCLAYNRHDAVWWKRSFALARKVTSESASCATITSFDALNDHSLTTFVYDSRMNRVVEKQWLDQGLSLSGQDNTYLSTFINYDEYGNVTTVSDPAGRETDYRYSSYSPSPTEVRQQGLTTTFTYDKALGVLLKSIDSNGWVEEHAYDAFGRHTLTQVISSFGNFLREPVVLKTYRYDEVTKRLMVDTERKKEWFNAGAGITWLKTTQVYDELERLQESTRAGPFGMTYVAEKPVYNEKSQVIAKLLPSFRDGSSYESATDASSESGAHYIQYGYDVLGRTAEVLMPTVNGEQGTTRFSYSSTDPDDERITRQVSSPQGTGLVAWQEAYNNAGGLTERVGPDGSQARYEYDTFGRLIEIIDPLGHRRTLSYNSLGWIVSDTEVSTGTTRYQYDKSGLLIAKVMASGRKQTFTYDRDGRLEEKASFPAGENSPETKTEYTYGHRGTDFNDGRLIRMVHTANDAGEGRTTEFEYNRVGQVRLKRVYQDLNQDGDSGDAAEVLVFEYQYNGLGQRVEQTFPDGAITRWRYGDDDGRLVSQQYKGVDDDDFTDIALYTQYHVNGRPTAIRYGNGVTAALAYDILNRPVANRAEDAQGRVMFDRQYEWNGAHKLTDVTDQQDEAFNETYRYSSVGRLTQAVGAYGTLDYAYDAAGNLTRKGDLDFVLEGHQISEVLGDEGGNLEYDLDGNLIAREKGADAWVYRYNADGRLVSAAVNGAVVLTSLYDHAGHRTQKIDYSADGQRRVSYYLDASFEVVVDTGTGQTTYSKNLGGVAVISEQVPSDGFALSGIEQRIEERNQVLQASLNLDGASLSLLLWQALVGGLLLVLCWGVIASSGRHTRLGQWRYRVLAYLVLMGWLSRRQARAWNQTAAAGGGVQPGKALLVALVLVSHLVVYVPPVSADLLPGANGAGVPVAGQTRYFHQDHLGSISVVTDRQGEVVSTVRYRPYGEIDHSHSSGVDDYRAKFTGTEHDAGTQLYYFGARYYDAQLGRFLSPDAAKQFHSPYLYGPGDPMSYVDPDGNFAVWAIIGLVLGVSFAASYITTSLRSGEWLMRNWSDSDFNLFAVTFGFSIISGGLGFASGPTLAVVGVAVAGGIEGSIEAAMAGGSVVDAVGYAMLGVLLSLVGDAAGHYAMKSVAKSRRSAPSAARSSGRLSYSIHPSLRPGDGPVPANLRLGDGSVLTDIRSGPVPTNIRPAYDPISDSLDDFLERRSRSGSSIFDEQSPSFPDRATRDSWPDLVDSAAVPIGSHYDRRYSLDATTLSSHNFKDSGLSPVRKRLDTEQKKYVLEKAFFEE